MKLITKIHFVLLLLTPSWASGELIVNKNDTTLFLGLIGPLFAVQHGLNIQISHQVDKSWSLDAEGGEYSTNSVPPIIDTSYASIGASFFINEMKFVRDYFIIKAPIFIRTSYSYHDDKKRTGNNGRILGRSRSNGVELSPGIRITRSWYSFELIPISFYFPIKEDRSGESPKANIPDRFLSFKMGLTF